MPAALPGSTLVQNLANPSLGNFVIFDLLSGPKGSPKDRDVDVPYLGLPAGSGFAASGNASTGGLSTGIGFGSPPVIGLTAPASIQAASFNDDYTPGATKPDGTAATSSIYMYIGGGRSTSAADAPSNPYTAGYGIGGGGNAGSRDAGAGPTTFTGFPIKTVTATGAVANGAAVETGFTNRSGIALTTGQSVFGSSTTASATPA